MSKTLEEIGNEQHIKWLSKSKTAIINKQELTVLPFGYVSQIAKENFQAGRDSMKEEILSNLPEIDYDYGQGEYKDRLIEIIKKW